MRNQRLDAKVLGLVVVIALVLIGAALRSRRRPSWTDHDVSDPGITL
jgi:hypothetical protein